LLLTESAMLASVVVVLLVAVLLALLEDVVSAPTTADRFVELLVAMAEKVPSAFFFTRLGL
jgi:hypothetical protein